MKKWMNRIGLALMAASAAAMIAADAFAGEPSDDPFAPTAQKFYLEFSIFSPADINCDATGPGVRTRVSRNIAGRPILRVTGNASGAQIECVRPDGSRYTTDINRRVRYNTAGPVYATVLFVEGSDAMTVLIEPKQSDHLVPQVMARSFTRVRP